MSFQTKFKIAVLGAACLALTGCDLTFIFNQFNWIVNGGEGGQVAG